MAVVVEMHNTGDLEVQRDVVAIVEHVLSDRPGDWRVLIAGSQDSDQWEMKIFGPIGFERSYTLEGTAGQHDPLCDCRDRFAHGAEKVILSVVRSTDVC